jgi:ABC-type multidrug transport system fused ATPase/permease subunit
MTAGQVIAFINLLNPLAGPIGEIPGILGQMRGQLEGARRVLEIIELPDERQTGDSFPVQNQGTVIAVKDVNYGYNPDEESVLNGLSFELKAGEKVAIVGPSGSGKSTIIKLLQGYYDGYEGDIRIYGHEISEWNLQEMRKNISFVSQDSYLFPGTIQDNISFGKIGATDEQIIAAAEQANAHEFVTKLESGYETNVGEFGDKLSGGQKQRISIARAMVKEAPIILLDEATSSLDSHSEYLVQEALDKYMKQGKTALIIAHRLSTIQKADRILVIENGRVVENGKHDELLNRDGVYRKLYLRQLAAQENEEQAKEAVV